MPGTKWSLFENGMLGLHLTVNPQKPLPPEARVNQQFLDHGLTLSNRDRASILRGRAEGVSTVKGMLDNLIPGFAPDARLKFANQDRRCFAGQERLGAIVARGAQCAGSVPAGNG